MAMDISQSAARGTVGAMAMTGIRAFAGALGIVQETPPEAIAKEVSFLSAVQPRYRKPPLSSCTGQSADIGS